MSSRSTRCALHDELFRKGLKPEQIVDAIFEGADELPAWEYMQRLAALVVAKCGQPEELEEDVVL